MDSEPDRYLLADDGSRVARVEGDPAWLERAVLAMEAGEAKRPRRNLAFYIADARTMVASWRAEDRTLAARPAFADEPAAQLAAATDALEQARTTIVRLRSTRGVDAGALAEAREARSHAVLLWRAARSGRDALPGSAAHRRFSRVHPAALLEDLAHLGELFSRLAIVAEPWRDEAARLSRRLHEARLNLRNRGASAVDDETLAEWYARRDRLFRVFLDLRRRFVFAARFALEGKPRHQARYVCRKPPAKGRKKEAAAGAGEG